jgi:hypothetical protein
MRRSQGQATVEFAAVYLTIFLPLIFGLMFLSEMFWVWHSAQEFGRDGARYAATHCWQPGGDNVINYMHANVPRMIDREQFQDGGEAQIAVRYFARDPDSRALVDFACGGESIGQCVPDVVTVEISNYSFRRFAFLRLPPVRMPAVLTSVPMESAGRDPDSLPGGCLL